MSIEADSSSLLSHVKCYPNKCNCEVMQDNFPVQPWSTYSNIPLLLLGIFWMFQKRRQPKLQLLSFTFIFTAIGSISLHGTFTLLGQILDFGGIVFVLLWVVLWYYFESFKKFFIAFFISAIFLFGFLSLGEWTRFLSIILVGLLLIKTFFTLEFRTIRPQQYLLKQSLVAVLFGVILFIIDNKQVWCGPHELLHGHLWWHLIGLFSMYRIMQFYTLRESEK